MTPLLTVAFERSRPPFAGVQHGTRNLFRSARRQNPGRCEWIAPASRRGFFSRRLLCAPGASSLGRVKTTEALLVQCIFGHVGSISRDFVDSNRALSNLPGLGQEATFDPEHAGNHSGSSGGNDPRSCTLRSESGPLQLGRALPWLPSLPLS
jgi:hypothetical protein